MKPIQIGSGDHVSLAYVGPLGARAEQLRALRNTAFLVTDEHIWAHHRGRVAAILPPDPFFVPRGEAAKDWNCLQALIEALAKAGHQRNTPIIALGGGSIGDLAGLAAALYHRGCPVIQIPTTLLAQVDSAVGGKTAIDAAGVKNLVGTFHSPAAIHADPAFLTTLSSRQVRAGIAEIVKYGAIQDAEFFAWLENHYASLLTLDDDAVDHVVHRCIAAKADAVATDMEDRGGRRALLNFGHSFGHAIEAVAGIGTILHGEAVAVGMMLAARYSEEDRLTAPGTASRLQSLLTCFALPTTLADVGLAGQGEAVATAMRTDKKNDGAHLSLILLDRIGQARLHHDIPYDKVAAFLR